MTDEAGPEPDQHDQPDRPTGEHHDLADTVQSDTLDLDRVEHDLFGVEAALRRLDDGTYWTDEVTGQPIPDEVLAADPVARRNPSS